MPVKHLCWICDERVATIFWFNHWYCVACHNRAHGGE